MTSNRRWLILPPAAAMLLVLGPLSMRDASAAGATTAGARQPQAPAATRANEPVANNTAANIPAANGTAAGDAATAGERTAPALPRTPDLVQVGSTLVGVLLLGGVGLIVLRRLRRGPTPGGSGIIALRQSLRLSPRQVVHALEFEGRLLLVGEGERGVQLLLAPTAPAADDEATVRAAASRMLDADDDGAVPKNLAKDLAPDLARDLVLPRPQPQPQPRPATAPRAAAPRKALGDFRALLAKVGR